MAVGFVFTKTHCRCFKCWRRKVLPRHPDQYLRKPTCSHCSTKAVRGNKRKGIKAVQAKPVYLKVDTWMHKGYLERAICKSCDGHEFPHRRGSRYCTYRKNGERRKPGDSDWHDPQIDREQQQFYQGD